ncbi:TcpQ domain-containing protein [Alcaligenaceae bacterium]|nr:TcpQ domain-containing protein [Alcaligenaceae bacterium]
MARIFVISILSGLLSACASMPDWSELIAVKKTSIATPASVYSFAWRLSGDRAVAPLQVFDNGRQTWLQFAPQQPLPAVFEHTAAGDRPLRYTREGPYMVLQGVWPALVLRGGHLKSLVQRQDGAASSGVPVMSPAADVSAVADVPEQPAVVESPASALTAVSFDKAAVTNTQPESLPSFYSVSPHDSNLRSALTRWAQAAGWMFSPEHWAVDADIPIVGAATFGADFKLAVQDLVAATELADRPLQPCFYSNQVLRIVPYAQQCDRTVSGASSS